MATDLVLSENVLTNFVKKLPLMVVADLVLLEDVLANFVKKLPLMFI